MGRQTQASEIGPLHAREVDDTFLARRDEVQRLLGESPHVPSRLRNDPKPTLWREGKRPLVPAALEVEDIPSLVLGTHRVAEKQSLEPPCNICLSPFFRLDDSYTGVKEERVRPKHKPFLDDWIGPIEM